MLKLSSPTFVYYIINLPSLGVLSEIFHLTIFLIIRGFHTVYIITVRSNTLDANSIGSELLRMSFPPKVQKHDVRTEFCHSIVFSRIVIVNCHAALSKKATTPGIRNKILLLLLIKWSHTDGKTDGRTNRIIIGQVG